jgi:hypothetical protein
MTTETILTKALLVLREDLAPLRPHGGHAFLRRVWRTGDRVA